MVRIRFASCGESGEKCGLGARRGRRILRPDETIYSGIDQFARRLWSAAVDRFEFLSGEPIVMGKEGFNFVEQLGT